MAARRVRARDVCRSACRARRRAPPARLQKHLDADEAAAIVENLDTRALVLAAPPAVNLSPDPKDNPVLAAAIAGRADLIVSGDKRHMLALGAIEGIPVVTARDALAWLAGT